VYLPNEIKLFEVLMKFNSGKLPFRRGHASNWNSTETLSY